MHKRAVGAVISLMATAVLAGGCHRGLQDRIVGKWQRTDRRGTWQLFASGDDAVSATNGPSSTGNYRFVDSNHVRVEGSGMRANNPRILKVEISGDHMITTDTAGAVEEWDRVAE